MGTWSPPHRSCIGVLVIEIGEELGRQDGLLWERCRELLDAICRILRVSNHWQISGLSEEMEMGIFEATVKLA